MHLFYHKESTGSTEDLISPGSMISFLDAIGDLSNLEHDVLNDSLFINDITSKNRIKFFYHHLFMVAHDTVKS